MTAPIRDTKGRFTDWRRLGRGSLGETWSALDARTARRVVVKVRPLQGSSRDICLREVALARSLDNPHLQRFIAFLPDDSGPDALIYDYVEGDSLKQRLGSGPIARDAALSMTRDILAGLSAAHQKGVVHRDISPENIILSGNGAVLIDFDAIGDLIADSRIGRTTVAGEFAGKPLYMSPEQITGAPQSGASDIWALGAVLFEAVTGQSFRRGDSISDLVRQYPKTPDVSAAPSSLRPLLADMLAPDPARRPDAIDAIAAIDALMDMALAAGFPADPALPSSTAPSRPPAPTLSPSISGEPTRAVARSGRRLLPWILTVVCVTGFLVIGAMLFEESSVRAFREQILQSPHLLGIVLVAGGVMLVASSFFVARFIRSRASRADVALPFRALDLINAPDARDRLTETICLRIDAYRELAGKRSEDMLSVTMVALAKEYAGAETADDRFRALAMLNELHMQVARSLRPWWMNYETLIARALSLTTLVAGVVAAVEGMRRLF
ncbi:serine/threonine-protein kinase [Sedimentitalea sp. JM2-8]|uniref:non-specific serine/threonine protein kinase n=1 Tax=Sedimentitalea xiamensis TaxID=3050037 RepID=A0ABT7FB75_9RHOB|nr:serine/threonine-protein kinase [Sedimentitalea xiamensis]MDK3072349.1 serine/threonine-protein kinase [Sedimentitalea xiamensis]